MFVLGAVPTTVLVYPLSHGLVTLAGAAIVGGLRFRPLVRVLDGKPLPTLPLRKEVDATPPVGPDLSEPGDSRLWIGEAIGTALGARTYRRVATRLERYPQPPRRGQEHRDLRRDGHW